MWCEATLPRWRVRAVARAWVVDVESEDALHELGQVEMAVASCALVRAALCRIIVKYDDGMDGSAPPVMMMDEGEGGHALGRESKRQWSGVEGTVVSHSVPRSRPLPPNGCNVLMIERHEFAVGRTIGVC
uniref:Uncharacterized protein n=1 Tax=Setaria digitata TaxID=48799 RepID=A0A915PJC2_9BILA